MYGRPTTKTLFYLAIGVTLAAAVSGGGAAASSLARIRVQTADFAKRCKPEPHVRHSSKRTKPLRVCAPKGNSRPKGQGPAQLGGGYDNTIVAQIALGRVGRWGGQCKQAVNDWVRDASRGAQRLGVDYNSNYRQQGGTEVSRDNAVEGDIIQLIGPDGGRNYYAGMHTAVVVSHTPGSETFDVVDSNWNWDEIIRHHAFNPYDTARRNRLSVHIWRMGDVAPPSPPPFNPTAYNGHIVKQDNGNVTAWLVTDGHRNWIQDQATYNCLKSQGHPGPDLLSAAQLDQLPDQTGVLAQCSNAPPPPPPSGADATPPSVPAGFAQIDNSQTAIRVAWNPSTDNVAVAGYDLYVNGGLVAMGATSSYVIGGLSCGTSYTLGIDAYDAAGNHSTQATAGGSTVACSAPAPSVSVSKGAQHTVSGCTSSACAYMVVSFANFAPGNHTVTCYADDPPAGAFYTYTTSSTTSAVCVYGYPGYHVWATVDGVSSGQLTW